jgi:electron transfer flavoprotein beta subunit
MQIIVLMKQVPNTAEIKIDPKTGNLIREGIESIINPEDRHAIELAISLSEDYQAKTTVVSMGPPQTIDAITEAMAMGIEKGVLLSDRNFGGADTWATSFTLQKAIKKIGEYDLILCGRQAIDGDTAQIGPQVAEFLNLPQVTFVQKIEELGRDYIIVQKGLEDGYQRIKCPLPALLTVVSKVNKPRYPRVDLLFKCCEEEADIVEWNAVDLRVLAQQVGLTGSLTRVIKTFAPKTKRDAELLKGSKEEVVDLLIQRLQERHLI